MIALMSRRKNKNSPQKAALQKAVESSRAKTDVPHSASVAVALICALVLFQGGFYPGANCMLGLLAGIGYLVLHLLRKQTPALPPFSLALAAIALLYLMSALVHGPAACMLQEATKWFALAGLSLWCTFDNGQQKRQTLDSFAIAGTVLAGLGILMFVGVVPLEGAVNAGRLMFTFQYANAAGLLFAVVALLALASERRELRWVSVVPLVALVLTQSVGALIVCACGVAALAMRAWRQGVVQTKALAAGVGVALVACVAFAILAHDRVAQAGQTFVERIIQIADAVSLLPAHAVLGIGPEQWQHAFPYVQSARYYAADVHCSYVQLALDAGVLAAAVLVAALAWSLWRLAKTGDAVSCIALAMVALHMVFDFDARFSAIVLLAALLAACPRAEELPSHNKTVGESPDAQLAPNRAFAHVGPVACWVLAACALAASAWGLSLDMRMGAVQNAAALLDADRTVSLAKDDALLSNDPVVATRVAEALYATGDFASVITETDSVAERFRALRQNEAATSSQNWPPSAPLLYRAAALYHEGDQDASLELIAELLDAQPFSGDLYEAMRQFIVEEGAPQRFVDAYNTAVSRSNDLAATGRASWLVAQEMHDAIE